MKYLILFLLPFTVYAGAKEDLDGLTNIRRHMIACGYEHGNTRTFVKKVILENDTVKSACLKSKNAEVEAATLKSDNEFAASKNAKVWHRANVVCANEATPRLKAECRILQR